MNRPLTEYELDILRRKAKGWSYGVSIVGGCIELGNGKPNEIVGLLPYELLMDNNIETIEVQHTIPVSIIM